MKILLLADEESKYLWDYFDKSKVEGIDLIISCGDLSPHSVMRPFSMSMAITTCATRIHRRGAASA